MVEYRVSRGEKTPLVIRGSIDNTEFRVPAQWLRSEILAPFTWPHMEMDVGTKQDDCFGETCNWN